MQEILFADISISDFSNYIFKVNHVFIGKEDNLLEKFVLDEEELDVLDDIDIDHIGNLQDLPRIVLID